MAAAQPFVSGAISKTINMPNAATVEDCRKAYEISWKLGLKANALYRDGSKLSQPLSAMALETTSPRTTILPICRLRRGHRSSPSGSWNASSSAKCGPVASACRSAARVTRRRPTSAATRSISGRRVRGRARRRDLRRHAQGRRGLRSLMNNFAIAISIGLQYGVPLEEFDEAYTFTRSNPRASSRAMTRSRCRRPSSTTSSGARDLLPGTQRSQPRRTGGSPSGRRRTREIQGELPSPGTSAAEAARRRGEPDRECRLCAQQPSRIERQDCRQRRDRR